MHTILFAIGLAWEEDRLHLSTSELDGSLFVLAMQTNLCLLTAVLDLSPAERDTPTLHNPGLVTALCHLLSFNFRMALDECDKPRQVCCFHFSLQS
jgi:hypothetical protein